MNRTWSTVAVLGAFLALAFATATCAARDDEKDKTKNEKPKNAPTLDDRTATVTETVNGEEKKKTIDLKYSLKVKGYFDKHGFHMEEVEAGGPAARLSNDAGQMAQMEKGDIIVEVEGKPVTSPESYAKAINGAADHTKIKVKVQDVNSGDKADFVAEAAKR